MQSSRDGAADASNADKRELVVGALAAKVNDERVNRPNFNHLVAGDFNVGHSDIRKNGKDLFVDCLDENCGGMDRYDDTHAMLSAGIVGGLRMRNLALGIPDTTFPGFPGSPIDNLYVVGPDLDRFGWAEKESNTFSSDHLAVSTTYDAP